MSAPQVSAWAKKPGAWALDAEEHEEELNQQPLAMEAASKAAAAAVLVPEAEFPSLTTAVATKEKKKKKKAQKTTLTLAEFSTYSATKERGLSHEDLINLPTGPRERSAEEMERSKFGGGFGDRDGRSWRGGGGDRDRDEGRSRGVSREPLGPSRADELDDWNVGKRSVGASTGGFERRGRTGGGGYFGSDSKADELDSWVSGKKSLPPVETGRRYSGLGSNGSADAETWGRKREERFENNGSSGGRPKLNLKPRSLPLSNDSRPHSPDVLVVKPESPDVAVVKRSVNPFGAARPREEVLAEKGQDWKKIDEQFESLRIKEQPGSSDSRPGSACGRDFGSWRGNAGEEKTESWRKSESVEGSRPTSSAANRTEEI